MLLSLPTSKFNTEILHFLVYYKTAIWHCIYIVNTDENKKLSTLYGNNVMIFQHFYKITINVYKLSWEGTILSLCGHILMEHGRGMVYSRGLQPFLYEDVPDRAYT
jgi:ABC-type long-subunit fatty acid transport system fused permease/ATPase subunit